VTDTQKKNKTEWVTEATCAMPADGGATNPWGSYIRDQKEKDLLKNFQFQEGPLGLGFVKSGDGFAITNVNPGGQAELLGIEVGTTIMRANKKLLYFMSIEEVQPFLMGLSRPLTLEIKQKSQAEIMYERRARVAAAPSTTAVYRHPLLTGNVEVSQDVAEEQAVVVNGRDVKHTPASMQAEKLLPAGVPPGRPFFWDCIKAADFVKAIGFSEEVSLNCLGKGVDGLYLMTITVEEAWGLGMNGEEDKKVIRKWITIVLKARTESKQECLQLLIGNYHKRLGILVASKKSKMFIVLLIFTPNRCSCRVSYRVNFAVFGDTVWSFGGHRPAQGPQLGSRVYSSGE
jgi:hypothetical protein